MLLDTIQDDRPYSNATLVECLKEQKLSHSAKTMRRRRAEGVMVYIDVHRDPSTGMRLYTGRQIREIVAYEQKYKQQKLEKQDKS